nr:hypothetical protein [Acidihalobacter prosperus]
MSFQLRRNEEQHQGREHHAEDDGIAHRTRRIEDQPALVVPLVDVQIGRQARLYGFQSRLDRAVDGYGVAAELLVDGHQHGLMAVCGDRDPLRASGQPHGGHVIERHHAVLAGTQHGVADLGEVLEAGVGEQQEQLVVGLQAADRADDVGGGERALDITHGQAEGGEARGIDGDAVFRGLAAHHPDAAHALHAGKQRHQLVARDIAQLYLTQVRGGQAVGQHRELGRVHAMDLEVGAGRQPRQHLIERRLHLQDRARHVGAPVEADIDVGRATAGGRADGGDLGYAAQGPFDHARDFQRHLAGRAVAGVEIDFHARKGNGGEQGNGHAQGGINAAEHQQQHQEQYRAAVSQQPAREAAFAPAHDGGVAVRTDRPSRSS